jgi:hypothetical protein
MTPPDRIPPYRGVRFGGGGVAGGGHGDGAGGGVRRGRRRGGWRRRPKFNVRVRRLLVGRA